MMTKESMKSKIVAAIEAAGLSVTEGQFNVLLYICQGIIEEIHANAQVSPGIAVVIPSTAAPGAPSSGATTSPGVIV